MPRLRQVPKDEATAPIVTTMYDWLFDGRDPVAEPGRWDGTTGDWWTVFALSPDILDHCVKGFGLYQSPTRALDPRLRELGQIRAGWAAGSQFDPDIVAAFCRIARDAYAATHLATEAELQDLLTELVERHRQVLYDAGPMSPASFN